MHQNIFSWNKASTWSDTHTLCVCVTCVVMTHPLVPRLNSILFFLSFLGILPALCAKSTHENLNCEHLHSSPSRRWRMQVSTDIDKILRSSKILRASGDECKHHLREGHLHSSPVGISTDIDNHKYLRTLIRSLEVDMNECLTSEMQTSWHELHW